MFEEISMNNIPNLDLKQIDKELKLILSLLTSQKGERLKGSNELSDIDWDLFLELAFHHRVYPILYKKIKEHDENLIPLKVVTVLEHAYKSNTFEMMRLCGEMEFINKLCTDYKIPVLFLKGPVLAADLYGDISLRTSCDLDILIPITDLEKMNRILVSEGYHKDDYILSVLGDWKWRHHHVTYCHPEKEIKVEVHWRLNPGPGKEPGFKELWDRKRSNDFLGEPVYYLGREDLFFFLVTHGSRHGWSRVRWLHDIHQLMQQNVDAEILRNLLRTFHCVKVGGQAAILSSQLLDSKISKELKWLLSGSQSRIIAQQAIFYISSMINLHSKPLPPEVSDYHKRHIISLMSFHQKALYTLSILYPYHTDLDTFPLPKILHFLYFPLRPFLWAWRKTKKHAFS
jgi:hypothetical protein